MGQHPCHLKRSLSKINKSSLMTACSTICFLCKLWRGGLKKKLGKRRLILGQILLNQDKHDICNILRIRQYSDSCTLHSAQLLANFSNAARMKHSHAYNRMTDMYITSLFYFNETAFYNNVNLIDRKLSLFHLNVMTVSWFISLI